MATLALWSRRILLAILGLLCLAGLAGAAVSGHALGAVCWVLAFLAVLALSAVLFAERYVSKPAAVISEVSKLLKGLPNVMAWLQDLSAERAALPPSADQFAADLLKMALKQDATEAAP